MVTMVELLVHNVGSTFIRHQWLFLSEGGNILFEIEYSAREIAVKILGEQMVNVNCEYRPMKYTEMVGDIHVNYMTGEGFRGEADRNWLIQHWFLVPKDFNDYEYASKIKRIERTVWEKQTATMSKHYVIFVTLECNAKCFYCFEHGWEKTSSMSLPTAEAVANYIKESAQHDIKITWFGGEPLCNTGAIDAIAGQLTNFESNIVTNGLLFNEDNIQKAVKLWHLKRVIISMDGREATFNKVKAFETKISNPYETVMANIKKLLDHLICVTVRLNVAKYNFLEMFEFIDELSVRFGSYTNFSVEFNRLYRIQDRIDESQMEKLSNYVAKSFHLQNPPKEAPSVTVMRCRGTDQNIIRITTEGKLQYCTLYCDEKSNVGSVFDDKLWYAGLEWKKTWTDDHQECIECCGYPICNVSSLCPHLLSGWQYNHCCMKNSLFTDYQKESRERRSIDERSL